MGDGRVAPARGRRTATSLVAALLTGGVGHVVGGGTWSGSAIAVAAALLLLPCWLMTARERGLPAIVAMLVLGQSGTHVTLTVLADSHLAHLAVDRGVSALEMVAAHVVATVVLAWWLRQGERRVWAGVRGLVTRLLVAAPVVHPAACPRPAFPETALPARAALLSHTVVTRGPPATAV
ncbi:hypothetical protein ACTG9Q_22580 [Actinokineospora sp. 24-640]